MHEYVSQLGVCDAEALSKTTCVPSNQFSSQFPNFQKITEAETLFMNHQSRKTLDSYGT